MVWAQPTDVTRVLKTIDFEERGLGNAEELPMHWTKVSGPGLPHYVNGQLATDRAHGGKYSFRLDLNGGGLIYRYDVGQIKVRQGAHYRVEASVQTTVLPHARARLTAYLVDIDGRPIASSLKHSELYAARAPEEGWQKLSIELSASDPAAAYMVLEAGLLQPRNLEEDKATRRAGDKANIDHRTSNIEHRTSNTEHRPENLNAEPRTLNPSVTLSPDHPVTQSRFEQDIHGSAWFDDINISQVPKVHLSTDRPGNIFRRGDTLKLQVLVNDRFTDDLSAQLVVRDAAGKTVHQRSGALDMTTAQTLGPGRKRLTVLLPELKPGWYEAALVMHSQGQFVGEQALQLVLLADDQLGRPDSRFGIIATDLPLEGWGELPGVLPFLAAERVKLAVWSKGGDIEQADSGMFDQLLEKLQELGIHPTACLVDLPPELSASLGGGSWLELLKAPREAWQPQLAELVARHAMHLDRWQLGADGSDAFVTRPQMRQVYAAVYGEFAKLVQGPDLAMPWPAWYELEGKMPATVALSVPPSVLPHQLPLYMQDLKKQAGSNLSISLELLDRRQYGREVQIRDLVQRITYALAADAQRIDIPLPLEIERDGEELVKRPGELLPVLHTLITTLSGTTFKGKVPIADGVEAFLFDKQGKGILVMWDRGNSPSVKQLPLNLGDNAARVDLWGNVTALLRSNGDKEAGQVQLDLGPMPILLVDIDGQLAQLRASVGFDRPLLESSFKPHTRRLHFTNPYKQAISGAVKLKAPAGWTLSPPTIAFTLNPGETFDREITIEFPYNSFAGPKTIQAEFLVQAEKNSMFSVPIVLKLGLSDVGMQSLALRDGHDVIVHQIISNYGDKPIDYTAFAIFPGQARQERLVTNLGPGQTTVKRYRFINITITPGTKVRAGVKENDGTRILNDELAVQ